MGWKAMWSIMTASCQDLTDALDANVQDVFGNMIGFGTFAIVFS